MLNRAIWLFSALGFLGVTIRALSLGSAVGWEGEEAATVIGQAMVDLSFVIGLSVIARMLVQRAR